MNTTKHILFWVISGAVITAALDAQADIVYYTLDDVTMASNQRMTGTFSWVYDVDDFENGVGQFLALEIPWTSHDENDLTFSFDIGKSIEITLPGSTHDDGVDISLVLVQGLTPTTSSLLNLDLSKYEIGGNGFHDGPFFAGRVSPVPEPSSFLFLSSLAVLAVFPRRR